MFVSDLYTCVFFIAARLRFDGATGYRPRAVHSVDTDSLHLCRARMVAWSLYIKS